jgi:hypothetical protein
MIDDQDITRLKDIFVLKDACAQEKKERDVKIEALRLDTAKVITKLNIVIAILAAIGSTFLGVAVKLLIGG